MKNKYEKTGFTLIELLIVVAIIAILAAIAIPNFLQAQVRAKVSRVKGNMASTATALEAYAVDFNDYPWDFASNEGGSAWLVPVTITTPVAYITSVPDDVFNLRPLGGSFLSQSGGFVRLSWKTSDQYGMAINETPGPQSTDINVPEGRNNNNTGIQYVVFSLGPGSAVAEGMNASGQLQGDGYGEWYNLGENTNIVGYPCPQPHRYWYDPTNGTVSIGYVERENGGTSSP